MKIIILLCFVLSSLSTRSQDSTDVELEKWLAARPYCDSIKSWYYYWTCNMPDRSETGNGENFFCRWKPPTKREVFDIVKEYVPKKKWKYIAVQFIVPEEVSHCPCQERKKAF